MSPPITALPGRKQRTTPPQVAPTSVLLDPLLAREALFVDDFTHDDLEARAWAWGTRKKAHGVSLANLVDAQVIIGRE